MSTTTFHFQQFHLRRERPGKCAGCGKKTKRVIRISETLNPFNKNAAGNPKTVVEIRESLDAKMKNELAKPLHCIACERKERGW